MSGGAAFEREELTRLLKASRLPEAAITDFERCNVGTIMQFASFAVGKLTTEPPDGPTLTGLLVALRTGSALAGADQWPDPGVAAQAADYTDSVTKMTMLCRYVALQKEKAALREMTYVGMAGTDANAQRAREEDEKKNHKAKALELSAAACAMYNLDFTELCDSSTLVATHHAFQRNRLAVARLRSGKYGHTSVHLAEKAHWVAADDHTIKEESSEVGSTSLTRNGHVLIQIFNVTESLVIAGASEINKTMAHSAGAHGTVNRGTSKMKQVNFDLTTKLQVDKAFTMLSGQLSPKALETLFDDQFIPTLGSMMVSGHSCASAATSIIANAAWMRVSGEKLTPAAGAGSGAEASAATPSKSKMNPDKSGAIKNEDGEIVAYSAAKVTQMRENHERQVAEMAAARKKDKERPTSWDGSPRPQTVYRGQYDQPRYDARHDEGQYDPRRDRK
jgi:hypothetical protein